MSEDVRRCVSRYDVRTPAYRTSPSYRKRNPTACASHTCTSQSSHTATRALVFLPASYCLIHRLVRSGMYNLLCCAGPARDSRSRCHTTHVVIGHVPPPAEAHDETANTKVIRGQTRLGLCHCTRARNCVVRPTTQSSADAPPPPPHSNSDPADSCAATGMLRDRTRPVRRHCWLAHTYIPHSRRLVEGQRPRDVEAIPECPAVRSCLYWSAPKPPSPPPMSPP